MNNNITVEQAKIALKNVTLQTKVVQAKITAINTVLQNKSGRDAKPYRKERALARKELRGLAVLATNIYNYICNLQPQTTTEVVSNLKVL